jgi:PPK2 family polyphosphate:nucleotide phosphotransferase
MKAKIDSNTFRVVEGDKVDLDRWPTILEPMCPSKHRFNAVLADHVTRLSTLQQKLYASSGQAILLILQGMDAAGKDGAIRHVMSGVNPQGCDVHSFKPPSPTELRHDFLWRATRALPERGRIGIFNRSYYEEVLVVRVHPEMLLGEGLPDEQDGQERFWRHRFRSISNLERHLHANGVLIIKIFLHMSKSEQRRRLVERIDDEKKNWKISASDVEERGFWKSYMRAYEACLSATSTNFAPWYVVPADDKDNARLHVSQIILDTLESLGLAYPEATEVRREELRRLREALER